MIIDDLVVIIVIIIILYHHYFDCAKLNSITRLNRYFAPSFGELITFKKDKKYIQTYRLVAGVAEFRDLNSGVHLTLTYAYTHPPPSDHLFRLISQLDLSVSGSMCSYARAYTLTKSDADSGRDVLFRNC